MYSHPPEQRFITRTGKHEVSEVKELPAPCGETQMFESEVEAHQYLLAELQAYALCLPPYNRTVSFKTQGKRNAYEPPYMYKVDSSHWQVICPGLTDSPSDSKSRFRNELAKIPAFIDAFLEGGNEVMRASPTVVCIDGSMVMKGLCNAYNEGTMPATFFHVVLRIRDRILAALLSNEADNSNSKVFFVTDNSNWVAAAKGHTQLARQQKESNEDKFSGGFHYDAKYVSRDAEHKQQRLDYMDQNRRAWNSREWATERSQIERHATLEEIMTMETRCDNGLLYAISKDKKTGLPYLMRFIVYHLTESDTESLRLIVENGQMVCFIGHGMTPKDLAEFPLARLYPKLITLDGEPSTSDGQEDQYKAEREALVRLIVDCTPMALVSPMMRPMDLCLAPMFDALAPTIPSSVTDIPLISERLLHGSLNPEFTENCKPFFQRMIQAAHRDGSLANTDHSVLCPLPWLINMVGEADQGVLMVVDTMYRKMRMGGATKYDQTFRIDMSDSDMVLFNGPMYVWEHYKSSKIDPNTCYDAPNIYNNYGVRGKKQLCDLVRFTSCMQQWAVANTAYWRTKGHSAPLAEPVVGHGLAGRVASRPSAHASPLPPSTTRVLQTQIHITSAGVGNHGNIVTSRDAQVAHRCYEADKALDGEGSRLLDSTPVMDLIALSLLNGNDVSRGFSQIGIQTFMRTLTLFSGYVSPLVERCSVTGLWCFNIERTVRYIELCYAMLNSTVFSTHTGSDVELMHYLGQMDSKTMSEHIRKHRLRAFRDIIDPDTVGDSLKIEALASMSAENIKKLHDAVVYVTPSEAEIMAEIQHANYLLMFISKVGDTNLMHPPEHLFAYGRRDTSKPISRSNIRMDVY